MAVTIGADLLAELIPQGADLPTVRKGSACLRLLSRSNESESLRDPDITPDVISNEYVIRVAAYLSQSRDSIGQLDLGVRSHAQDPARAAGARALIASFLELTA